MREQAPCLFEANAHAFEARFEMLGSWSSIGNSARVLEISAVQRLPFF